MVSSTPNTMRRRGRKSFPPRVAESPLTRKYIERALMTFFGFIAFASLTAWLLNQEGDKKGSNLLRHYRLQPIYYQVDQLSESLLANLDVVLVLGGGVPSSLEEPPFYVKERCDFAAQVVQKRKQLDRSNRKRQRHHTMKNQIDKDLPVLCLSAGTAHLPQLMSPAGLPVWESTASAAYLQSRHQLSHLFVETTSYDTIGNAFYTRTSHTDINGLRNLLIITSEFHMNRTKAIFDWIFLTIEPKQRYSLEYLASPNTGLSNDALAARYEREKASLKSVYEFSDQYQTLREVYGFMTEHHGLYAANKLVESAKALPNKALKVNSLIKKSYGGNTST